VKEATEALTALRLAQDIAETEDGLTALFEALRVASNPGASGTIASNAEKALTNLVIAHTAIRVGHSK